MKINPKIYMKIYTIFKVLNESGPIIADWTFKNLSAVPKGATPK
jgi:hypothetical protein